MISADFSFWTFDNEIEHRAIHYYSFYYNQLLLQCGHQRQIWTYSRYISQLLKWQACKSGAQPYILNVPDCQ